MAEKSEKELPVPVPKDESSSSSYSDAYYQPLSTGSDDSYAYSPTTGSRGHRPVPAIQPPMRPGGKKLFVAGTILLILAAAFLVFCGISLFLQIRILRELTASTAEQSRAAAEQYEEYSQTDDAPEYSLIVEENEDDDDSLPTEALYEQACAFTVAIAPDNGSGTAVAGTGIILTEDGYILTNYHVIETAYESDLPIDVLVANGTEYTADITGVEEDCDLAVLKIDEEGLTAAPLSYDSELLVGQTVYTLGNPMGELSFTLTRGIISALDRRITTDSHVTLNMFQLDAAINSGNSGGPVLNEAGLVVGIVTARYSDDDAEGLGFAIPISDAVQVADELISKGYVSGKAYLGLTSGTLNSRMAAFYDTVSGVYVYEVEKDSCADTAGIRPGDIITAIGDTAISEQSDLIELLRSFHAGDTQALTIYRDGAYLTVTVTFDEDLPHSYSRPDTGESGEPSGSTEPAASGEPNAGAGAEPGSKAG